MKTANTFVRKIGDKALVIMITGWDDFNELDTQRKTSSSDPDYLVPSSISKTIISGMQPAIQVNCYKGIDISEQTKGLGIAGILTEGFSADAEPVKDSNGETITGIWGFKDMGESVYEHFFKGG